MSNVHPFRYRCSDWLAEAALAPHVGAFKQYLTDRRYAATTFANYVGGVGHFAQWLRHCGVRVGCIDDVLVAQFLDEHLPRCRCAGRVQRDRRGLSAALGHLLVVLRAQVRKV